VASHHVGHKCVRAPGGRTRIIGVAANTTPRAMGPDYRRHSQRLAPDTDHAEPKSSQYSPPISVNDGVTNLEMAHQYGRRSHVSKVATCIPGPWSTSDYRQGLGWTAGEARGDPGRAGEAHFCGPGGRLPLLLAVHARLAASPAVGTSSAGSRSDDRLEAAQWVPRADYLPRVGRIERNRPIIWSEKSNEQGIMVHRRERESR
jgi:hypothetical protein